MGGNGGCGEFDILEGIVGNKYSDMLFTTVRRCCKCQQTPRGATFRNRFSYSLRKNSIVYGSFWGIGLDDTFLWAVCSVLGFMKASHAQARGTQLRLLLVGMYEYLCMTRSHSASRSIAGTGHARTWKPGITEISQTKTPQNTCFVPGEFFSVTATTYHFAAIAWNASQGSINHTLANS